MTPGGPTEAAHEDESRGEVQGAEGGEGDCLRSMQEGFSRSDVQRQDPDKFLIVLDKGS